MQRAARGHQARRNVEFEEQELSNAFEVQPQGEVTNFEFHEYPNVQSSCDQPSQATNRSLTRRG